MKAKNISPTGPTGRVKYWRRIIHMNTEQCYLAWIVVDVLSHISEMWSDNTSVLAEVCSVNISTRGTTEPAENATSSTYISSHVCVQSIVNETFLKVVYLTIGT